jgi:alkyldihydroxyacetonephosphate synthase
MVLPAQPRASEGPELRELLLGSEGRFAVITDAALRVRPRPEARSARAWRCASFLDGADALRRMLQAEIAPPLVRLSDEVESAMLGVSGGALLLTGVEGAAHDVPRLEERIASTIAAGAASLDRTVAERWFDTRFDAPYLRDALLERDVLADSLETAALWSDLATVYERVRAALAGALDPNGRALVLCHISHAYAIGASLYFTFLAPGGHDAEARWRSAKRAALDAIVGNGGVVSHHHGIGRDHREWLAKRYGSSAARAIDAVASAFDPNGVLAGNRPARVRTMLEASR